MAQEINVEKLSLGPLETNCYIVGDENECIIIDPGATEDVVIDAVGDRKVLYILLTHSHYDHIGAVPMLREKYGSTLGCSEKCSELIQGEHSNLSIFIGDPMKLKKADTILTEGDTVDIAGNKLSVLETEGHCRGSLSFIIDKWIFTGDLIFYESIGRTDFPGGDLDMLKRSVREKVFTLGDEMIICSGHGPMTTVVHEKENNIFLMDG
ncbi:MBL fold metallo-hydrolase [Spirochaetota bacterium]